MHQSVTGEFVGLVTVAYCTAIAIAGRRCAVVTDKLVAFIQYGLNPPVARLGDGFCFLINIHRI